MESVAIKPALSIETIFLTKSLFDEINQKVFQNMGSLIPTSKTRSNAQAGASLNIAGLLANGVHVFVTENEVNGAGNLVRVIIGGCIRSICSGCSDNGYSTNRSRS